MSQESPQPSLNKTDAVVQTEPLALACLFSRAPKMKGYWTLHDVVPMDALGDLQVSDDGQARFSGAYFVCGPLSLRLSRDEAEGYLLNLDSPEPSFFCLVRHVPESEFGLVPQAVDVTLSYNQAARWMDGGEQVERVLAAQEILPWMAEFTELHYEAPEKKKRKGNKPSFMKREEFDQMAKDEAKRFAPNVDANAAKVDLGK
jgi:Protein of unknown function (DUF3305)